MEPLHKLPFTIIRQYFLVLKQNFNGELPWIDVFIFWIIPAFVSVGISFATSFTLDSSMVGNLLTIHGIFVSVLVTSYVPFLDYLQAESLGSKSVGALDALEEMEKAKVVVKGLLFAINSFSILLSLLIVVALIFYPVIERISPSSIIEINGLVFLSSAILKQTYLATCLYMIQLNILNIFRTLQIIYTLVSPKIVKNDH